MLKNISYLMVMLLSMAVCSKVMEMEGASLTSVYSGAPQEIVSAGNNGAEETGIKLTLMETYRGFQAPTGIAVDGEGNIYVSNWSGSSVTKVDANGNYSAFADGMGSPAGLAFDNDGNLYVADYSMNVIYRISQDGSKSTFVEGLYTPTGISFNRKGELLIANRSSNQIVKVNVSGNIELVADGMRTPVGVVEDRNGDLYVTNYGGGIIKVFADGTSRVFSANFGRPGVGIDISQQNEIFAADNVDECVRQIYSDGSTRIVVDNIGGCVAVLVHENSLYIGSWDDGAVYKYALK